MYNILYYRTYARDARILRKVSGSPADNHNIISNHNNDVNFYDNSNTNNNVNFYDNSNTNNNHYNYTNSTVPRFKKIMLNVRNMRFTVTEMLYKCDSHGLMLCRFAWNLDKK